MENYKYKVTIGFPVYNVEKYIDQFNKRITPLLVCFHPDIRNKILITDPKDRMFFTEEEAKRQIALGGFKMGDAPAQRQFSQQQEEAVSEEAEQAAAEETEETEQESNEQHNEEGE